MKLKYLYYAQCLINYLLQKGIPASEVHRIFGIPRDCKYPMEYEPAIENIHDLTMYFMDELRISHCGLEMVRNLTFQNTGFFGSYALSCSNLHEAFRKTYAVHQAINTLFNYEMSPQEKPYYFVYQLDPGWEARFPDSAREIMEFAMANGLYFSRKITRQEIKPRRISFTHSKPEDTSLYEELFQCPIHFNEASNEAIYQEGIMELPIPSYNPILLEILEEYAEKTIREQEDARNLVATVRGLIIRSAHTVIPHIDEIAFQLNTSRRSLQLKLKEHGTSFKELLDEVLRDLSISYLRSSQSSNKEIAWLLGYSDLGNFYRAFKRWTGKTPNEFRNSA